MPVRSGPVRRDSSSRASCGRLSASALGPWSPWLSSSKMLSACTSPRRTIETAFSFEMCRALNTASTGKSTASSGANSSSALGPGKTVVSASAPKVRNACQLSPSSDSTRRHFGQRPSRGMAVMRGSKSRSTSCSSGTKRRSPSSSRTIACGWKLSSISGSPRPRHRLRHTSHCSAAVDARSQPR